MAAEVTSCNGCRFCSYFIYAKATSQKLCLYKFMTTAREREKFAKRISHRICEGNESETMDFINSQWKYVR